jgi:Peptidase M15
MTPLTPHFALEEFAKGDPIPSACIGIFTDLAEKILEPVRSEFQKAIVITSGYRSSEQNREAHGIPNSEHVATTFFCACDFYVEGLGSRFVFDWMRQNPTLPFHQLILESDASGGSIIHVSYNKTIPGVRSVLIGATHNAAPYQKVYYVAYESPDGETKA